MSIAYCEPGAKDAGMRPTVTGEVSIPVAEGPEHDSDEWRAIRNSLLQGWIEDPDAVAWLLDYFDVGELFDDLIDKDKEISKERIHRVLWETMVDMPSNPFFRAHASRLLPLISAGISAWLDANDLEAAPRQARPTDHNLRLAYGLRGLYMQIVQEIVCITRGREAMREHSLDIVRFFQAETYEEYKGRFATE